MSLNSENLLLRSPAQESKRKAVHLNTSTNPGFRKYEPLLSRIGASFGFSDSETSDLVEQISFYATDVRTDSYALGLKIWLSKLMVRKCIFKISKTLFSQNASIEVKPRVLSYHSYIESSRSCIQNMPLSLRTVYILKSTIEFDEIEIAEILNVSAIKIKDRFQAAKFFLNNC